MSLSISEKLMHSTIRIEVLDNHNNIVSTGSGFFFSFKFKENQEVLTLVTNKHVVENSNVGRLVFTEASPNNKPKYGVKFSYSIDDFENAFIPHPDPNIDLCIMPVQPILEDAKVKYNKNFFIISLDETLIPSSKQIKELSVLEDIIMIGYPNGLRDEANNLPIIRRGVTAVHPKFNYNNKTDIVIDAACFPGSSGSPVCIFNQGSYTIGNAVNIGSRFFLLGILYAGPQHTAIGEIHTVTIPTAITPIAQTNIMINIGYAVKSSRLLDFKQILEPILSK